MSKIIEPSNEFLFVTYIDKSPNNLISLFSDAARPGQAVFTLALALLCHAGLE